MAFLNNYLHDIFVSYKHFTEELNPICQDQHGNGWTELLVQLLQVEIDSRLQDMEHPEATQTEIEIWMDPSLRGNEPLSTSLENNASGAALLLLFMSKKYLKSEWCGRERDWFITAKHKQPLADERIFIINTEPVEESLWPSTFKGELDERLIGYDFYSHNKQEDSKIRPLCWPIPQASCRDYNDFYRMMSKLADDVVYQLKKLKSLENKKVTEALIQQPSTSQQPKVFLAYSSSDLEEERETLFQLLESKNLKVVDDQDIESQEDLRKHLKQTLPDCDLFVQLLSKRSGMGSVVLQAKEAENYSNMRIIQWCSPTFDINNVNSKEYRSYLDSIKSKIIQLDALNDLAEYIADKSFTRSGFKPISIDKPKVFVKTDKANLEFAKFIQEDIVKKGLECHTLEGKNPSENGAQRDELSIKCDGVILVRGKSQKEWVIKEVDHIRNLMLVNKSRPPLVSVINAPPPQTDLNRFDNDIPVFDCSKFDSSKRQLDNELFRWLEEIVRYHSSTNLMNTSIESA